MSRTGLCRICRRRSPQISSQLGVCGPCIKAHPDKALSISHRIHATSRQWLGLPGSLPRSPKGVVCNLCPNRCELELGDLGFCGLYANQGGKVRSVLKKGQGLVSYYKDPHPTNCVASWCCAGGSRAGYPTYSVSRTAETGWSNAAAFLGSCTYHCLFCQNSESWRHMVVEREPVISDRELAFKVLDDPSYTCLCWFGGCPSSQIEFVLSVSTRIESSESA
jgi:pyruvate formate lyase activating enzyme